MSEWTQLASARGENQYGLSSLFRPIHIVPQQSGSVGFRSSFSQISVMQSPPGQVSRFHIYDDPAYWGNARPTALAVYMGDIRDSLSSPPVYDWQGAVTLYLWTDETRTQGVWAKITERFSQTLWSRFSEDTWNSLSGFGAVWAGLSQAFSETAFMLPIPSNLLTNGLNAASSFVGSRLLTFGVVGQPTQATYDLSLIPQEDLRLEIAVVQFPDEETATCVVGDFSKIAWHYIFDSGISFRPEGFVSPFTLASIDIESDASPKTFTVAGWPISQQVNLVGPRLLGTSVCRYSAGQFEEYHHDGHYPPSTETRFARTVQFGNGFPMAKPRNGALPSTSENAAYGLSAYTAQRSQFTVGNFSVPKQPAAGHWTVFPASSPSVNKSLQLKLTGPFNRQAYPGFPKGFDYLPPITFSKTGVDGDELAHNCAYAEQLDTRVDLALESYWYTQQKFSPNEPGSNPFEVGFAPTANIIGNPEAPHVVGPLQTPFTIILGGGPAGLASAAAWIDKYNEAIASGQYRFVHDFVTYLVYVQTTWEQHSVLRQMQAFATMSYAYSGETIFPQNSDTPNAAVSTSGNLDAWIQTLPAPINAIGSGPANSDLQLSVVVDYVFDREARNIREWVYPAQIFSSNQFATLVLIGGNPQPGFWRGETVRIGQEYANYRAIAYNFSKSQAALLESGGLVTVNHPAIRLTAAHRNGTSFLRGLSAGSLGPDSESFSVQMV